MSYTPHEWQNNEFITAEKLNHIEGGIAAGGSGVLICNASYDSSVGNYRLDKTAQEIYDAWLAGVPAYIKYSYGVPSDYTSDAYLCPIIKFSTYQFSGSIFIYASKAYSVSVDNINMAGTPALVTFLANGLNDYPVFWASPTVKSTSAANEGLIS